MVLAATQSIQQEWNPKALGSSITLSSTSALKSKENNFKKANPSTFFSFALGSLRLEDCLRNAFILSATYFLVEDFLFNNICCYLLNAFKPGFNIQFYVYKLFPAAFSFL
jgi:hypothetical protein